MKPSPERLSPDPSVALVAYRFPASEPGPQKHHDVALMLGDPVECPVMESYEHFDAFYDASGCRVVCRSCRVVLRWWQCDCPDSTFRERPCKHISQARELYAAERRAARGRE